ncbi:MAG TPA: hypothetical protein VF511_09970, partial [Chthoniobacterales bacterium]
MKRIRADNSALAKRTPGWWATPALAGVLFALIVLNNSELIFQSRIYEHDDYAADSLQVLKAKKFRETLGHYCRFQFHHPGPAFFYVFAWAELALSDALRVVPTPFNAQLVAVYALGAFFFSAALIMVARHLPRGRIWFLGLSLVLAAWHFGAVGKFYEFIPGHFGVFCPWPPCLLVFPFLCFVVGAASVASGTARDLPVTTLAACFLVHGYACMPLFVVPLTVLAYALLLVQSRRERQLWPWRIAPHAHWLAGGVIALFLVPIVADLVTAHPNNLERVLRHLRTGSSEHKSLLQSVLYFLHFGAYSAYPSTNSIPALESFDWPGTVAFFTAHWKAYGLWVLVLALALILSRRLQMDEPDAIAVRRFGQRLGWFLLGATALTLAWGCLQEGPMFYYTSLFNFAIYYGGLLLFALVVARWIEQRARTWPRHLALTGRIALFIIVVAACIHERRRFRTMTPDQRQQAQFADAIEQALKLDPVEPKFFNFDWQAGGQTTRVALYLERHGHRWLVREDWPLLFGEERIVREGKAGQPVPDASSSYWRVGLHG